MRSDRCPRLPRHKPKPHMQPLLMHGLANTWSYFLRTTPDIAEHLQPIDSNMFFIPTLTGRDSVTENERDLFALPACLGGLGLGKPRETVPDAFSSSQKITASLVAHILQQSLYPDNSHTELQHPKAEVKRLTIQQQCDKALQLQERLPRHLQRAKELSSEKGASSWLSILASATPGSHPTFLASAHAANPSLWTTPSTVTQV